MHALLRIFNRGHQAIQGPLLRPVIRAGILKYQLPVAGASEFFKFLIFCDMPTGMQGSNQVQQYEDVHDVHLTISDSGIGIPKDKLRLLGTPFFTMKQDGKGMGLAQVFNTIQNNKAKIRVTSEEGQGTTFILSFSKNHHQTLFKGGQTMLQAIEIDARAELAEFLVSNLNFYTKTLF